MSKMEGNANTEGLRRDVEARAVGRHWRMSPRKVRLVADLIRGKRVDEAVVILKHCKRRAARPTLKLLKSAMANARETKKVEDVDSLYVKRIFVDEGPTWKRWLPRARGRADRILKRTCHTTIVLGRKV